MRTRSLALLVLPVLIVAGCTPTPAPPGDSSSDTPAPVETTTAPVELDPDVLLVVTATATADSGAVLNLTMTVHQARAWNDASARERPALMTSVCEGALDDSVYEVNLWSFVRIDVSAVDSGSTPWTDDKRLRVFPHYTEEVTLASEGFLVQDEEVDQATPFCARDRLIYGAGEGTLIAGLQGDTDAVGAAGQFTRWANHLYGFVGREVAGQSAADAGITITGCTYLITDAGTALNGGAEWWGSVEDDSNCYVGAL